MGETKQGKVPIAVVGLINVITTVASTHRREEVLVRLMTRTSLIATPDAAIRAIKPNFSSVQRFRDRAPPPRARFSF